MMRRRDFITLLGSAAWPLVARAQQPALPVIGFLNSASSHGLALYAAAFQQGLREIGYVEGQNLAIEYRWAEGAYDRLPAMASDLVRRQVAVIAAGGPPAAQAAKAATSTIPIVFTSGADPVKSGLVASLNRPDGNVTGVHLLFTGLEEKKLGLLREIAPQASVIAVLLNPITPDVESQARSLQAAARTIGRQVQILNAKSELEIDAAFGSMAQSRAEALLVGSDPFFFVRRDQIVALAARYAIPAIYETREWSAAGGLMSYGTNLGDAYHQAGIYVGKILKGAKPADLPVMQLSKFELVINLNTAKTLGLTFPPGVLAIADDVIE